MKNLAIFLVIFAVLAGAQSKPFFKLPSDQALVEKFTQAIVKVEEDHLKTDDGFKAAVVYLQSEKWTKLVDQVLKTPEYQEFEKMALKYKFNITQVIRCLRKHIECLKVNPAEVQTKPNLEPFILDVQKALPLEILAKALSKNDTPEAVRIREEVGSKKNQKIAENLHNLPEMAKMREILKGMNFDVQPYITLVYTFLGWVN